MRRIGLATFSVAVLTAFLGEACCGPVSADPLDLTFSPYRASEPANAGRPAAQAAPGSSGAVGQRYAAAAAPQTYAAPPPQPPRPNLGGGFLEAIFGGSNFAAPAPRAYQPALPSYQSDQPQANANNPSPAYAPSSQGDMASTSVDPKFDRQVVEYRSEEKPGTIVIDTPNKFLYLVENNGKALRYGIGVGRPGFTWAGIKSISAKREWPDWRPPADMLQ